MYQKEKLSDSSLQTIQLNSSNLGTKYQLMDYGMEGFVYKYSNDLAIKIFNLAKAAKRLKTKYQKIELLGKLNDASFAFPKGLCGFEDGYKSGYYMDLIHTYHKFKDFDELYLNDDIAITTDLLIKASQAMERIHSLGIYIGDVQNQNILINENLEPIFIDTDNYLAGDYNYDITPTDTHSLQNLYNKPFSNEDIDNYLMAILALQFYVNGSVIRNHQNDEYFVKLIDLMDISKECKDALRDILSDHMGKPAIGPILQKIKPNGALISRNQSNKLGK